MAYTNTEITAPRGINKDLSPYELPPDVWSDGANVNFRRNRTNRQLGYRLLLSYPSTSVKPLFVTYFSAGLEPYWVYADEASVWKTNGTVDTQLASGFSASRDDNWSSCDFNSVLVMNNQNDHPQYLPEILPTRAYDSMVDLPFWGVRAADTIPDDPPNYVWNWGPESRCSVIRPYKNYLFALDCWNDKGVRYPNMVRWSSPAQLGDVPPSWDPDSPSEQAGLYSLSDTPGRVLDGLTLGDYFVIYKTDSVWLVQFVGGDFNFSFRKLFSDDAGMLNAECVAEFDGKHFVMSTTGAYIHNGATKQEIMDPWVKDEFFNNVAEEQLANARVVADHNNREIWVYYTTRLNYEDAATSWCDKALVWNWETAQWTIRELTGISYIAEGFAKSALEQLDPAWNSDLQVWDSDITIWNSDQSDQPDVLSLVLADYNNSALYKNESANTQAGQVMIGWVERIGIDMNDDHSFKYLSRVIPHIIGEVPVQVTLYSSNTQVTVPTTQQTSTFDPKVDWNVDCHVTGRYLGIKFSCDGDFELNGYTLVWETTGQQ